jgi:hypothetical protein
MTVNISIIWLILIPFLLIEAALLYWYHIADSHLQSTIVFFASVVAGAFALFSYVKGIQERRKQSSERLIERWNNPDMRPFKDAIREITEGERDPVLLMRKAKGEKLSKEVLEARSFVVGLLGFYEEVSIAVRKKSAEEATLKLFMRAVVCQCWDHMKPWIENERKIDNEAGYYTELQWLADRWSKKG